MITLFRSATDKNAVEHLDIDAVFERLRKPGASHLAIIKRLRAEPDEKKQKQIKAGLPAFSFSGRFDYLSNDKLQEHSGYYVYDYDHVTDPQADLTRLQGAGLGCYVGSFISPRGQGYKVVLAGPVAKDAAAHIVAWRVGSALLAGLIGADPDPGSDVARLCYIGGGDAVHTAAYWEPFGLDDRADAAGEDGGVTLDDMPKPTKRVLSLDTVRDMLWTVGSDLPYAKWRNVIWAVVDELSGEDEKEVAALLEQWSTECGGERGQWSAQDRKHFHHLIAEAGSGEGATIATLVKLAKDKGWVDWRQRLKRNDKGQIRKSQFNVDVLLKHHREFKGRCRLDMLSGIKEIAPMKGAWFFPRGAPIEKWSALWAEVGFEQHYNVNVGGADNWLLALEAEAMVHEYNPRIDYLNDLKWDGEERLRDLWEKGFGAEASPLNREIAKCWLCAAAQRQLKPGTSFQIVPVLWGPGGTGKTEALKALVTNPHWMVNSKIDMSSKEGYAVVQTGWIVELAEMSNMRRNEQEEIKGFVTQTHCRFRRPWDRNPSEVAATWVFVGTTNEEHFLKDLTGNRRWLPIAVKGFPNKGTEGIEWVRANRDQLWAEAMHIIKGGGHPWELDSKWYAPAAEKQEAALHLSEMDIAIGELTGEYENMGKEVSMTLRDIGSAVGLDLKGKYDEMQLGSSLKHHGWARVRTMVNGSRSWRWAFTPPL